MVKTFGYGQVEVASTFVKKNSGENSHSVLLKILNVTQSDFSTRLIGEIRTLSHSVSLSSH